MAHDVPAYCENCRYWMNSISSGWSPEETGQCRRLPPHPDFRTGLAAWPFTEERDWCGEHSPVTPSET